MVETATNAISIFAPLVFVVVVELATLTRENDSYSEEGFEAQPVLLPSSKVIPPLGRLNAVHGLNLLLLSGTLLIVVTQLSGLLRSVLSVLVVIVWASTPLLEIEVYGQILECGQRPWSLYFNGFLAISAAVIIGLTVPPGNPVRSFDLFELTSGPPEPILPAVGAVLYLLVAWLGFLHLFYWETKGNWPWDEDSD